MVDHSVPSMVGDSAVQRSDKMDALMADSWAEWMVQRKAE